MAYTRAWDENTPPDDGTGGEKSSVAAELCKAKVDIRERAETFRKTDNTSWDDAGHHSGMVSRAYGNQNITVLGGAVDAIDVDVRVQQTSSWLVTFTCFAHCPTAKASLNVKLYWGATLIGQASLDSTGGNFDRTIMVQGIIVDQAAADYTAKATVRSDNGDVDVVINKCVLHAMPVLITAISWSM